MSYVPQTGSNRRPFLMWLVVALGSFGVVALIVGAPLGLKAGLPFLGLSAYRAFSHVCHQIPERSFFIAEHPFAVCSRCFGLYAGFATASLLYPLVRSLRSIETPARKWLFLAAAPMAIDFAVEFFGVGHNTHSSRFSTGALLGAVAVFYVMPGLLELSLRVWSRTNKADQVTPNPNSSSELFPQSAPPAPSDYSAPHRRI